MATKKPAAAETASTSASGATPPATEGATILPNAVAGVAASGSVPVTTETRTPELQEQGPPVDDLVPASVLSLLVHDGVSYPEGSIVTLTAAQHAELSKAGVVSSEPTDGLPY